MIIETLVPQKKNLFQLPMNGKDFIVLYLIPPEYADIKKKTSKEKIYFT